MSVTHQQLRNTTAGIKSDKHSLQITLYADNQALFSSLKTHYRSPWINFIIW